MKFVFSMTLALALLASAPALAEDSIDVMTQNQYLGADLTPIITATNPPAFNAALIQALQDIAANDYPARASKLAELITDRLPELAGLQEMFEFVCHETGGLPGACVDPSLVDPPIVGAFNDHLTLTLDALADLDETYVPVATVKNLNLTFNIIPGLPDGLPVDLNGDTFPDITVTVLDRDVILARDDVDATPVDYSAFCPDRVSADGCNYRIIATAPPPLPGLDPIEIQRGWVGVDATIGDKDYRFVNTHLEVQNPDPTNPLSPAVQAAQAQELIGVLAASTPPPDERSLIVVGDINSSSEDPIITDPILIVPPYTQFVGSGYTDAWDFRPGNQPGYTCCQLDDLSNHQSILDERIDVIFSIEEPNKVKKARVLGAKVSDKTSPPGQGLWPSDHGSVAAELQFP